MTDKFGCSLDGDACMINVFDCPPEDNACLTEGPARPLTEVAGSPILTPIFTGGGAVATEVDNTSSEGTTEMLDGATWT